jgi:hypothetical protein
VACTACGREFHEECATNCHDCHEHRIREAIAKIGAPVKSDDQVTDVLSTGRKRAAKMYGDLMDKTLPCEWRGKKNVGGGIAIFGCINGFRQDIHHGPDKTTTNNSRANVHLICKKCHKRWHTVNDPVYDRDKYLLTKHEPFDATHDELYAYELKWQSTPRSHITVNEDDDK